MQFFGQKFFGAREGVLVILVTARVGAEPRGVSLVAHVTNFNVLFWEAEVELGLKMREMVHPRGHARSDNDDAIALVDRELLRSGLHLKSDTFGVHWSEDSARQFAFWSHRLFLFRNSLFFLGRGDRYGRAKNQQEAWPRAAPAFQRRCLG